jgi:RNA polymerase sigma factor (sigma-70 family)
MQAPDSLIELGFANPAVAFAPFESMSSKFAFEVLGATSSNGRTSVANHSNDPEEPLVGRPGQRLDWSSLMASGQAGDTDAYRRLLETLTPYLRSLAVRRLGDRSDAEDVVQEILLTVHAIRHTYDPKRPFGPWLIAIASRRIVDRIRKRGRDYRRESALLEDDETFDLSPANLSETALDARTVREAVNRLAPAQREAVRLLKLEEMSLKEAAAASGMSIAALKVACHRGLKALRKRFR